MKPEVKAKWIEALRSGAFPQGTAALKHSDPPMYCCLGVLCEITPKIHWYAEPEGMSLNGPYYKAYCEDRGVENRSGIFMPVGSEELTGLNSLSEIESLVDREYGTQSLVGLNDDGLTFPQIADIIEYFL